MQYIYEDDNKSALERLGRQATFKFRALWSVRDGKGLIGNHIRVGDTEKMIQELFWRHTPIDKGVWLEKVVESQRVKGLAFLTKLNSITESPFMLVF